MWKLHETKLANHYEYMTRDDGTFVGYIIQFNKGEKTFAWTAREKVGMFETIGEAKDAIEELL